MSRNRNFRNLRNFVGDFVSILSIYLSPEKVTVLLKKRNQNRNLRQASNRVTLSVTVFLRKCNVEMPDFLSGWGQKFRKLRKLRFLADISPIEC